MPFPVSSESSDTESVGYTVVLEASPLPHGAYMTIGMQQECWSFTFVYKLTENCEMQAHEELSDSPFYTLKTIEVLLPNHRKTLILFFYPVLAPEKTVEKWLAI